MKKLRENFSNVLTGVIYCAAFLLSPTVTTAQSFRLFAVSDMVRVFGDGYNMPRTTDTIKVFGIRGEIISGQFAINAKKTLLNATVEINGIQNRETRAVLSPDAVQWNFVGSVPLSKNAPNQPAGLIVRQAPALFPDYLMQEREIDISAKTWQPVWLTISIPLTSDAGIYHGKVTVKSKGEEQFIPLVIRVFPLTLPSERHLKVVEWYTTDRFAELHRISTEYSLEWFGMLRKYADNMVAHRQNVFQVPMESIIISRSPEGRLIFDFSRFDQIADVFWNTGKMDLLETGELTSFGKERWSSTRIYLKEFPVFNSGTGERIMLQGNEVIPFLMPAYEDHLRQKGWLNKSIFGIKDEPSVHNALSWKDISSDMHKYAPDLKRFDAIETTQVLSEIELAVPKLDHFSNWYDTFRKWQKAGHELWFYTVGIYQGSLFLNKTIDMPLIDCRLMHWLNYRYDATGYLHWGWNQWTEDPYKDPDIHIGDGWHVYPVKDGVLNSVRWEEMRNGIQDYEYLRLLEDNIRKLRDSLGTRFSWIDPQQRGVEIAGRLIKGFADISRDPDGLEAARLQLIREIMESGSRPGIYLQTNPAENSVITSGSTVEVCGWTEPGTRIKINGSEIPVSGEGLFLEQFGLSRKNNRIVLQAEGASGKKEIVREFTIR